jgi:hypothetical protein
LAFGLTCRVDLACAGGFLGRFQATACPGLDPGWLPVRVEEKHVKTNGQHDPEKRVPVFRKIMLKQ